MDKKLGLNEKVRSKIDYLGMPAGILLDDYGDYIIEAFNPELMCPYIVGSSLCRRDWRDVDVRLIMMDDEYERWAFGDPVFSQENPKWRAFCLAFSLLGKQITGLPIDFQIQQMTFANKKYQKGKRHPIGRIVHRAAK